MISAWHLLWIIPACSIFGFMICAILASGRIADLENLLILTQKELSEIMENEDDK